MNERKYHILVTNKETGLAEVSVDTDLLILSAILDGEQTLTSISANNIDSLAFANAFLFLHEKEDLLFKEHKELKRLYRKLRKIRRKKLRAERRKK